MDYKLLWLLCSGLLLAGTVEACPNTCMPTDQNPHMQCTTMNCPEGEHSLSVRTIEPVDRVCYERMREAMRMVTEGMYLSVPRDGRPSQWLLPIPKGKADLWDAVIRECVK